MTRKSWKRLFLSLAAFNILIILYIAWKVLAPTGESPVEARKPSSEPVYFNVSTKKQVLNQYINQFIGENFTDQQFRYQVTLSDFVELSGDIPIFSKQVRYQLTLEPIVTKNGDLLLNLRTIKLGQLNLPVNMVLDSIGQFYQFPDWVQIYPKDQSIYIAVTNIKTKNGSTLAVSRFDLKKDLISFRLYMP